MKALPVSFVSPRLASRPSPARGTRDQTLRDGTVRWNTGLDFCFLIEDEMKKTLVTAGRRLITSSFVTLFCFCYFFPRRSHCV